MGVLFTSEDGEEFVRGDLGLHLRGREWGGSEGEGEVLE